MSCRWSIATKHLLPGKKILRCAQDDIRDNYLVAHEGYVTGVVEELVDGPQYGRRADGCSMDAAINVTHEI
jgi:hypothetical protein